MRTSLITWAFCLLVGLVFGLPAQAGNVPIGLGCDATFLGRGLGKDIDTHCHVGINFRKGIFSFHGGPFVGFGSHLEYGVDHGDEDDERYRGLPVHHHRHIEVGVQLLPCLAWSEHRQACAVIEVHDDAIASVWGLATVSDHWWLGGQYRGSQIFWSPTLKVIPRAVQLQAGPAVQWHSGVPGHCDGLTGFLRVSAGLDRLAHPHRADRAQQGGYVVVNFGFDFHPHEHDGGGHH